MKFYLNSEQTKGLASFFFDIAKGLVIGGIGFSIIAPLEVKILTTLLGTFFAFFCIKFALSLLEEIK